MKLRQKKKREGQLLRMTLNNKVERMKARIEMEEQEKLLPKKRKRKSKHESSEGKDEPHDDIIPHEGNFTDSKRHKLEHYNSKEFHSKEHKKNVKMKPRPPSGPALSFNDLLKVAAKKQHEPIELPEIDDDDDDDDQRPLTKKARRMLIEEENRVRRKMAAKASALKETNNNMYIPKPKETNNGMYISKSKEINHIPKLQPKESNNLSISKPKAIDNSHSSRPRESSTSRNSSRPREISDKHSSGPREINDKHNSRPREISDKHNSRPREISDKHSSRPETSSYNKNCSRPEASSSSKHASKPKEANSNHCISKSKETNSNQYRSRVNGGSSRHLTNDSSLCDIPENNSASLSRKNLNDHDTSGRNRPVVVRVQNSKANPKLPVRPVPQAKNSSSSNNFVKHSSEANRPNPLSVGNSDKRKPAGFKQQSTGRNSETQNNEKHKENQTYKKDLPPTKNVANGNYSGKNHSINPFKAKADLEKRKKNFLQKGSNGEKPKIAPSSMHPSNSNGKLPSIDKETLAEIERRIRSEIQKEMEAKLSKSNNNGSLKKSSNFDTTNRITNKHIASEKKVSSHPPFRTSNLATQNQNSIKSQSVNSKPPSGNVSFSNKVSSSKPTMSVHSEGKGNKDEMQRTLMGRGESQKLPSKSVPIQNRPQMSAKSEIRKEMLPPRKQPIAKPPIPKEQKPRFHPNPYLQPPRRLLESRRPMKAPPKRRIESDDDDDDEDMNDFIDDGAFQDDNEDYSKYIKEIFGYDRSKYMDEEDDEVMETSFAEQMKEEVRSAKIGYLEDQEDIKKEKEELMRKKKKLKK